MSSLADRRFSQIPEQLRIRILLDTDDFVVIEKPCNLRSVPGHANPPPPPMKNRKRPRSEDGTHTPLRRTAHEAWVLALRSFQQQEEDSNDTNNNTSMDVADQCLQRLATSESSKLLESVPRKYKVFRRYVQRNQKRLLDNNSCAHDEDNLESLAKIMFQRIEARQRPLMNLPEPTSHEESAVGQLVLMGYAQENDGLNKNMDSSSKSLLVVHRLDCEVSCL
jgi:23S rRNA-/tRNA-specific pseudouridylate synthase